MARVTPISVVYTLLLLIAVLMLTMPAFRYYTNPTVAAAINDTYKNVSANFQYAVYSPSYAVTFNSSSGLKAAQSLNLISGLAFMFGGMYQAGVASLQAIPMINTVFGALIYYAPLPDIDIAALLGLLFSGVTFLFIWFLIASWTKVEA